MKKHLHYYTQHSQYNEPTDKPAVSYCELEDEVHYAAAGSVTLITFTIGGTSYQAEEGMTWEDWVNSNYNINEWYIYNNQIENSILSNEVGKIYIVKYEQSYNLIISKKYTCYLAAGTAGGGVSD